MKDVSQRFAYWNMSVPSDGTYVVGSKSFRPDIQKPRQMKTLWGINSAIYGEVNVSVEKCVEIKGDYVEK